MLYRVLADAVLLLHFLFVVFVVGGGFAVLRWHRLRWVHIPIAAWGAFIEFAGWICPLTPLEIALRRRGGEAGYSGGFIEHYITAAMYPAGLTRQAQWALGALVLLINAVVYALLIRRLRRTERSSAARPGSRRRADG
jgi:hypothetical protein